MSPSQNLVHRLHPRFRETEEVIVKTVFLIDQALNTNLLVILLLTLHTPLTRGSWKNKSCEALIPKILGSYLNYDLF